MSINFVLTKSFPIYTNDVNYSLRRLGNGKKEMVCG